MLDIPATPIPATIGELFDRLLRLGRSVQDVKIFRGVTLTTGANFMRHECKSLPRAATAQIMGTAAPTVTVAVDPTFGATFITIHASGSATVDVVVYV